MTDETRLHKKIMVMVCITFLLVFLSISGITLVPTSAYAETRIDALLRTLTAGQNTDGSFPFFEGTNEGYAASTAEAILTFHELNGFHILNVEKAVEFIISRQDPATGGLSEGVFPLELYSPSNRVVPAMDALGRLDELNTTLLRTFTLSHYNDTDGGFFEPNGLCYFFLILHTLEPLYNQSNIISTWLGINLLDLLGAVTFLNITRTIDFVKQCRAENGGFRPFPNATLNEQPVYFPTDSHGTGLPYTFCAIKTLEILGALSNPEIVDSANTAQYIWSCQSERGGFWLTPSNDPFHYYPYDDMALMYTYYALEALSSLNLSLVEDNTIQQHIHWILSLQSLQFESSIPNPFKIPSPPFLLRYGFYGLFQSRYGAPITNTFMAIRCLSTAEALSLIAVPTQLAITAWQFVGACALWTIVAITGFVVFTIKKVALGQIVYASFFYFGALIFSFYILSWIP